MRIALDTNVILYAEGVNDENRRDLALRLINAIGTSNLVVPLQVLGETLNRLTRGTHMKKAEAVARLAPWFENIRTQDTDRTVFEGARDLVAKHHFQIWDAIILSAASAGGASILLSEDMHDGFRWRETIVVNPFTPYPPAIVRVLLGGMNP